MIRKTLLFVLNFFSKFGYQLIKIDKNSLVDQKKIIPSPKVIFDIGSNRGQTTELYLNLFAEVNALIYSFEPIESLVNEQKSKFKLTSKVIINQIAFSNKEEEISFYINHTSDTSSILEANTSFLPPRYGNVYEKKEEIKITTMTVDQFCSLNNIHTIDILKIDVQGYELNVLAGSKEMLAKGNIKLIYSECLFLPIYKGQCFFDEIVSFLQKFNYRLFMPYNFSFNFKTGRPMQCDAIFVHESVIVPTGILNIN